MNITNGGQHSVASGERSSNNSFDATSSVFPETELPPTHCPHFCQGPLICPGRARRRRAFWGDSLNHWFNLSPRTTNVAAAAASPLHFYSYKLLPCFFCPLYLVRGLAVQAVPQFGGCEQCAGGLVPFSHLALTVAHMLPPLCLNTQFTGHFH